MDEAISQVCEQFGCSRRKARKILKRVVNFLDACEKDLEANPFDRTVEELTDQEIMAMRTMAAEQGTELTPKEIMESVELLRYARKQLRGEEW